jgi:hypothetical protein
VSVVRFRPWPPINEKSPIKGLFSLMRPAAESSRMSVHQ